MNLQEMQNQITDLGTQIRAAAASLRTAASQEGATAQELADKTAALNQLQNRMEALKSAYDVEKSAAGAQLAQQTPAAPKTRSEILRSNEYARAFAWALVNGVNPRNGHSHADRTKILYDALTETGGNPAGADGGFLVPEDIDHQIREQKRALNPLAPLFGNEYVTSPTGWRVVDTAPTTGFAQINEMGTVPRNVQPVFAKVTYSLSKYGLILPVSNELAADEVANLFAYISRWFAKKDVILENSLLVGALDDLTASALDSTDPIGSLKAALNVDLDPAISLGAVIITNQSGFNALDQLLDGNDRPLLQPDPTNATLRRLFGRPVHVVSDATIAPDTTNSVADIYIGDAQEYATLFTRQGLEIVSTDVGGNAFVTDSIEVRGITRKGVSKFDTSAMVRRTIGI